MHQRESMAILGFVHVVSGDENGMPRRRKLVDQIPEIAARNGIDTGCRLVQK